MELGRCANLTTFTVRTPVLLRVYVDLLEHLPPSVRELRIELLLPEEPRAWLRCPRVGQSSAWSQLDRLLSEDRYLGVTVVLCIRMSESEAGRAGKRYIERAKAGLRRLELTGRLVVTTTSTATETDWWRSDDGLVIR